MKRNWLDRVVESVAPRRALSRARARVVLNYIYGSPGGYKSGRSRSPALKDYDPYLDSAITALHPSLDKIRARSRDQVRNSPVAHGAVGQMTRSVIGSGLKPQPQVLGERVGLSEEQEQEWSAEAKRVFDLWSRPEGGCHVGMELSFSDLQVQAFRGVFEGGDVLLIERYMPERGSPFGTCFQLIEAERISNPQHQQDTQEIAGGVEVDVDTGLVKAYHVRSVHPGEEQTDWDWIRVPAWTPDGKRVARLLFPPTRIGERRGVPWLASIIEPLRQLEQYTDAELQAAVLASLFTVFVTQKGPDLQDNLLKNFRESMALNDGSSDPAMNDAEGDIRLDKGSIVSLAEGEDISIADPARPNSEFAPFIESVMQQIGIALGIPYEVLSMRYQSSYSAAKGALAEAWKAFRDHRAWMISQFCQPAYECVLEEAILTGLLSAPDFESDPLAKMAYSHAVWMGEAPSQIDPDKEITAAQKRIEAGVSTIDSESRQMTGTTFEENFKQRKREVEMMKELEPEPAENEFEGGEGGENGGNDQEDGDKMGNSSENGQKGSDSA